MIYFSLSKFFVSRHGDGRLFVDETGQEEQELVQRLSVLVVCVLYYNLSIALDEKETCCCLGNAGNTGEAAKKEKRVRDNVFWYDI